MTFAEAMRMIKPDGYTSRNAAKRPNWGGYVFTTKTSAEGASTLTYTLTFKKRNGDTFVYTWNGSAWTADSTALTMDGELLAAMAAEDWDTGAAADFETARSGANNTW